MQGKVLKAFRVAVESRKRELDSLDPMPEEKPPTEKVARRVAEQRAILVRPEPASKGRIGGIEI